MLALVTVPATDGASTAESVLQDFILAP